MDQTHCFFHISILLGKLTFLSVSFAKKSYRGRTFPKSWLAQGIPGWAALGKAQIHARGQPDSHTFSVSGLNPERSSWWAPPASGSDRCWIMETHRQDLSETKSLSSVGHVTQEGVSSEGVFNKGCVCCLGQVSIFHKGHSLKRGMSPRISDLL